MSVKSFLFLILSLLLAPHLTSAQDKIYIWSEIDPGWKNSSLEYWESVKGYGKSVPVEMSDLINEYHSLEKKNLALSIEEELLNSKLSGSAVLVTYPGGVNLKKNDLFLDMQCKIFEITEAYPNFRVKKVNIEPAISYTLTVYNSSGDIVSKKEYTDKINFKEKIRPLLRGMSEHRRDIEIIRHAYSESFAGEMPGKIITDLADLSENLEAQTQDADPEKFRKVVSMVFEKRKLLHPGDYQALVFKNSPADNQTDQGRNDRESDSNAETARQLNTLIADSKYYALIIGINEYNDPDINDLEEPLNDAANLYEVLTNNYSFEEENISRLINPTRNDIIRELDRLAYQLSENDNLIIFYAGHGLWDEQLKKGYWIPTDATTSNRANWFSNSDLRDYIGGIKAKHTLLISDACFGGGIFKTRQAFADITPAIVELYKLPSRKAMTSGAMTTVPDKSVFIEYLIKRLEENDESVLSAEQLFASFKIAVINNSSTNQVPQFGEIRETGDEGGDFLFIKR